VLVPGKPFQPSLRLSNEAEAYPSQAPLSCSTLGQAPDVTHKKIGIGLLRTFVNYVRKKLYNVGPKSTMVYQQCMSVKNNVKGFPLVSSSHTFLQEKLAILKVGEKSCQC